MVVVSTLCVAFKALGLDDQAIREEVFIEESQTLRGKIQTLGKSQTLRGKRQIWEV
jgi:hypothetical protein